MGKIRQLPPDIISRIAAGEVIERPSFAVKELLENALDAGATDIKIEIEQSGLKKIQITDNGEGMDQDDLFQSFLPHTTSKLIGDNFTFIATLGFRGEALASIASISHLKIISRVKDQPLGYLVEVSHGKILHHSPAGSPLGTSITVENLFASVPARKKFLRSPRTESRHILDMVTKFALSYPQVRFELSHNGKLIFDLLASQALTWEARQTQILERVKTLLGPSVYETLIPIKYEESYLKLSGYLCKPQLSSSTKERQHLFINGRLVSDTLISGAVKEAYGQMLESTSYPIFLLFLNIPYETVDVNIHPRKEQISFYDPQFIYNTICQAVTQTLTEHNLTFSNLSWVSSNNPRSTQTYLGKLLKNEVLPWEEKPGVIDTCDVIQLHNLYLLCPTSSGVILFDQHAAHERVLFNQFLQAFQKQQAKKESYPLHQALLLDLSPADSEVLDENLSLFTDLGFTMQKFGNSSWKVEAIPKIFQDWNTLSIIGETLDDLRENGKPKEVTSQVKRMLSYLACRSAIKAGDKLTKQQAKDLIKQLSELDLAYTCPHGRPLKMEIPLKELDKLFKR